MKILITGAGGFIGFSLAKDILLNNKNVEIYGVDNFDNYYSKKIKFKRINNLKKFKKFKFVKIDITNRSKVLNTFKKIKFKYIVHLAAQAGVRYSQNNPQKYLDINIFGFINILDATILNKPKLCLYASSSSVYGDTKKLPATEEQKLDPINIYAMTKKTNEIIAKFYSNYYNLNFVGLRYFTVYGEWGRPDMFLFKLFKAFHNKDFFYLNNAGKHKRDFTYIKDAVLFTKKILFTKKFKKQNLVFNICSNNPLQINKIVDFFYKEIGKVKVKNIKRNRLDVKDTHGNNVLVKRFTKFNKFTNYKDGILNTYKWYKEFKIFKIK